MRTAFVATAVLAALVAGCGGDGGGATKAGGAGRAPVTLRIGTDDVPGKPASDQIEEFARRVKALSGGDLRIEPVWHAAGDGPDWDQRVARMVTAGKLEMGMIPSRSWDTEGVTSLRALNAPFLLTDDALVGDVVSGELASDLMSGLDEAGVAGLALVPEGLRHPFGLERPLLGPEDYEGRVIRTPTSATTAAVFEALGARVNDKDPDASVHAGLESGYNQDVPGTATGNVTFYPKVNSLVIDADALDELASEQRDTLRQAAIETRDWAIARTAGDGEQAAAFCAEGSAVVLAGDDQLRALERATEPVYAELERDEQTRGIIAAMRELKQATSVSAPAPEACGRQRRPGSEPRRATTRLDGVYRYETTDAELRRFGVTERDDLLNNHGVTTYTFKGSEACWVQHGPNPEANADDCHRLEVEGDVLRLVYDAGEPDVYRFKQLPNGDLDLRFVSSEPGDEGIVKAFGIHPWRRIGNAK